MGKHLPKFEGNALFSLLSKPLTTKEGLTRARKAAEKRRSRQRDPEKARQMVKAWRAKNPNWAEGVEKRRWAKTVADPELLAERNRLRREWRHKNRDRINAAKVAAHRAKKERDGQRGI